MERQKPTSSPRSSAARTGLTSRLVLARAAGAFLESEISHSAIHPGRGHGWPPLRLRAEPEERRRYETAKGALADREWAHTARARHGRAGERREWGGSRPLLRRDEGDEGDDNDEDVLGFGDQGVEVAASIE